MQKHALIVLLDNYADWEIGFLAPLFQMATTDSGEREWELKTVSLNQELITSMGGLTVLPDLAIDDVPDAFDALILIGGMSWRKPEALRVVPLVHKAKANNAMIAGICDAANFLGWHGFLNDVSHTGNAGGEMVSWDGTEYTNEAAFKKDRRAVTDGNIITADGASPVQFTEHVLRALRLVPEAEIDEWVQVQSIGEKAFYEP